jgi:hypothetical protein
MYVIGFEAVAAATMKSAIFRNVTLCSPLVHIHFGRTYYRHLQGRIVSQENSKKQADIRAFAFCLIIAGCLLGSLFYSEG